jgi:hypothetical protein
MLAVLLFDVRVEVGELPATAGSVTDAEEFTTVDPAPTPTRPTRRSSTQRTGAPTSRRFAWAPSPGATGYYVEFFRGTTRVYARETADTALELPARWQYRGVKRSFRPGEYRWYVWPVVSGRRDTRAAVQATISIPTG